MAIAYIRPDKNFEGAYEQLKSIMSYALANGIEISEKFIDHTPKKDQEPEDFEATKFFRSHAGSTLLVADVWTFGNSVEEIAQAFSCLFKNDITVHFVEKSIVASKQSSAMFVLGLLDNARQLFKKTKQKRVGRPKGSKSSSKFDVYLEEIMRFIQEGKSVSEMARTLGVSRSSLKDYIESRELKQLAGDAFNAKRVVTSEEDVINRIQCPDETEQCKEGAHI